MYTVTVLVSYQQSSAPPEDSETSLMPETLPITTLPALALSHTTRPCGRAIARSIHGEVTRTVDSDEAVELNTSTATEKAAAVGGMAATRAYNVVEAMGVNAEKGIPGASDSSNQENAADSSSVRRPSTSHPRVPLSNGANGVYLNQVAAQTPNSSQILANSESDSLLNLYGESSTSNLNLAPSREGDLIPDNMYRLQDYDPDLEKWIHRDKLAKIENEELQAAGFQLTQKSPYRTGMRAQSEERLGDHLDRTPQNGHWVSAKDENRLKMSPVAAEGADSPEASAWDLRAPEEVAVADHVRADKPLGTPVVRKNGSKIPVLTSSPLPIPSERLERETPLPRKRTISGSIEDGDTLASAKSRTRATSVGSQNRFDDAESPTGTPTLPSTNAGQSVFKPLGTTPPTMAKSSTKIAALAPGPANTTRKITPAGARKPSNTHKPRVPSNSNNASPVQQPSSRSADPERPRTAVNRPEGEAPWLATMYKPDPRLPPDQQIIPTHFKKQQQHQYSEHERLSLEASDRGDTSPLHRDSGEKKANQRPSPSPTAPGKEDPNAWPLRPTTSDRSTSSGRPGTSGSYTGGYSTMPKVASSPLSTPPIGTLGGSGTAQVPHNVQQSPPPDQRDKKGPRNCACCIVM